MQKKVKRIRRALKTRSQIAQSGKHRLSVFKTSKHIYAQIFDADLAKVKVCCSTVESDLRSRLDSTGNKEAAAEVGKLLAERAKEVGIEEVAFDRSGFKYHGRISELANMARENGLKF